MVVFGHQASERPPARAIVPRFEREAPLPTIPGVMMDSFTSGSGLAEETAKGMNLQARILWIDATANIDRYNSDEKIVGLVRQIKEAGFNTIVFDIKPISGQVVYPSHLAPKLLTWRGQDLPPGFDPVKPMIREARKNGLSIFTSLNAFSEGHRLFSVGPGYQKAAQQTVLYTPKLVLRDRQGTAFDLNPKRNQLNDQSVSVFGSVQDLPKSSSNGYVCAIDRFGQLLFESIEKLPKGAQLLYGPPGAPAAWLKQAATSGRIDFDTEPRYVPMGESKEYQIPLMMNPNDPAERQYVLDIAKEVVTNYDVDGFVYDDRFRYAGLNADFSETTRSLFEQHVGKKLTWPDDVFKYTFSPSFVQGIKPGPYYDAWMSWRAQRLHDFFQEIKRTVKEIRPSVQVGLYVGSWYGDYPALGDNYASAAASAGFWFLTPAYRSAGLASNLDLLITGCYYTTPTIYDAMVNGSGIGSTVEAAASLTNRLVRDQTWTYAGISLSDFEGNPDGLLKALQAACASSQGVMVFDLSHNIQPMWPVFHQAFLQPRVPPHRRPKVLADVRRRRAALDSLGVKDLPIVIATGSSGAGQ